MGNVMANPAPRPRFCGHVVDEPQLDLIRRLIAHYPGLSRTELAATACELLGWLRANGKPKTVECRAFLDTLEAQQRITLPARRSKRSKRVAVSIATDDTPAPVPIQGPLAALGPVRLQPVVSAEQRSRWRALVEQHHYLGHRIAFGAHLRYLIESSRGTVGCLQYASPAWRLQGRDQWIGWSDAQRRARLQHVVCNSRFLILPWVQVPNLASHVLALGKRQLVMDWQAQYGVTPWLLETLVDPRYFRGTCYRAANWIAVGETRGRGRDDR
ncbi:Druantia anti-phage system protein DruA, partial [Ectothiorhodospira variabilis]